MMRFLPTFRAIPVINRGPSSDTCLTGKRIVMRGGDPSDWRAWRMLREMSRDFLVPWEPSWTENGMSYHFFSGMLRRQWRDWSQGKGYAFFVFLHSEQQREENEKAGGILIGGLTLSDVVRGIAQKATVGYWMGQPYAGQGYMTEAAQMACDFAFNTLNLHRVEASCLPHNEASKKLLKRLDFDQEGYAKAYLQINGQWQDHLLWGKTHPGKDDQGTR